MELRYLRDTDKREVDFVVLKDSKPVFAVELKTFAACGIFYLPRQTRAMSPQVVLVCASRAGQYKDAAGGVARG